jgi:hypothetical protein
MERRAGPDRSRWLTVLLVVLALAGGLAVAGAGSGTATTAGDGSILPGAQERPTTLGPGSATTTAGAGASGSLAAASVAAPGTDATAVATSTDATPSLAGPSAAAADATGVQSDDTIVERVEYDLLPSQPDTVEARIVYEVPDGLRSLNVTVGGGQYEVRATDGFDASGGGTFEWDGSDGGGTITIRHAVDESFREESADQQFVGGTREWAIVTRPQTSTRWCCTNVASELEYRLATVGEGYAGDRFAFLGSHETLTESVDGEQLTLVVPDAADPASDPAEILASMTYASEQLRFENRNEEVVTIVAPASIDWGPPGLAIGADARVTADARVDDPVNVWVHEYVHTRQYRDAEVRGGDAVADDAHWLIEGSADYYAALMSLREGRIDYETFRDVLERGTEEPASGVVLAEPATWADNDAEYEKGALVVGAIDRELRAATDGTVTFQAIMAEWNSAETFTGDDLEAAVAGRADDDAGEFVRTHTRTEATPSTWDRTTHADRFDARIARFDYDVVSDPPLSIAGPYREGAIEEPLVIGETIAARVTVENVGDVAGQYRARIVVSGQARTAETGELAPGETETVDLSHRLDAAGDVRIVGGGVARTVRVREPASVTVSDMRVEPRNPLTGDGVEVTVGVANPTNRPANGTVTIRADGEAIATEEVRLAPGENGTIETTTSFDSAGTYEISADGLSLQVTVEESGLLQRVPLLALVGVGVVVLLLGLAGLLRVRG